MTDCRTPINSPRDDFGVQLDETGDGGYFSSDRTGVDACITTMAMTQM